jgi:hypothetical protein
MEIKEKFDEVVVHEVGCFEEACAVFNENIFSTLFQPKRKRDPMRKIYRCLLALSLLASLGFSKPAAAAVTAGSPTWEGIGPYAISWVMMAPSNSQILFAFSKSYTVDVNLNPLYSLF